MGERSSLDQKILVLLHLVALIFIKGYTLCIIFDIKGILVNCHHNISILWLVYGSILGIWYTIGPAVEQLGDVTEIPALVYVSLKPAWHIHMFQTHTHTLFVLLHTNTHMHTQKNPYNVDFQ